MQSPHERKIYITEADYDRLKTLIEDANPETRDKQHLRILKEELERGEVVASKEIPNDVITMNSKVRLKDLGSDKELVYTLVYPKDANIEQKKISVLAPIGTAIIGYRVGDTIEWNVPAGVKRLKVEAILYQPESAGDFHL